MGNSSASKGLVELATARRAWQRVKMCTRVAQPRAKPQVHPWFLACAPLDGVIAVGAVSARLPPIQRVNSSGVMLPVETGDIWPRRGHIPKTPSLSGAARVKPQVVQMPMLPAVVPPPRCLGSRPWG